MKPNLPSAMLAGALAAVCLIALADPPRKHNGTNTVSEVSTTLPSTSPAATLQQEDAASAMDVSVEPARRGHDSMHPQATQAPASADNDETEAQPKTVD